MKKSVLFPIILFALAASAFSQETDGSPTPRLPSGAEAPDRPFDSAQGKPLERPATKLRIVIGEGKAFEYDVPQSAYVRDGASVQILPGETIYVEMDFENGKAKNLKAVSAVVHPEKTVTLKFEQKLGGLEQNGRDQMILTVVNPFDRQLIYRANMYLIVHKKWVETDVWPVPAKLMGMELWPDPLASLVLYEFSLADEAEEGGAN
jgi:hypothetical protein